MENEKREQPEKTEEIIEKIKEKYIIQKKNRSLKRITVFALLALCAIIVFTGADMVRDALYLSNKTAVEVELSGDEGIDDIADMLKEKGIIKYKGAFKAIAKSKRLDSGFGEGKFVVQPKMKYTQVLRIFFNGKGTKEEMVTFAEGLTKNHIFEKLSETGFVTKEELEDAEKNGFDFEFLNGIERENILEGYLFPETYSFTNYQTPKEMIEVMLNQFEKEFTAEYKKRAEELGMTVDEVVILASVIQAETAGEDNMKKVSQVFRKRLENGEKLQSCATIQYLLNEKKFVLSAEDLKIDSPYNTYMYYGLPKGPICSPSRDAIKAALYPADTKYSYFQSDRDGNMYFSESFAKHEQIRKEIQGE